MQARERYKKFPAKNGGGPNFGFEKNYEAAARAPESLPEVALVLECEPPSQTGRSPSVLTKREAPAKAARRIHETMFAKGNFGIQKIIIQKIKK